MATLIRRNQHRWPFEHWWAWDPFRVVRDVLRWDPFREIEGAAGGDHGRLCPHLRRQGNKEGYVFRADLPGVKEEDLEISLTGNRLTISGKREQEKREQGETYYATERSYGSFSRAFTLPDGTDGENVKAELKNGVLQVNVPKKPEVQPRRSRSAGPKPAKRRPDRPPAPPYPPLSWGEGRGEGKPPETARVRKRFGARSRTRARAAGRRSGLVHFRTIGSGHRRCYGWRMKSALVVTWSLGAAVLAFAMAGPGCGDNKGSNGVGVIVGAGGNTPAGSGGAGCSNIANVGVDGHAGPGDRSAPRCRWAAPSPTGPTS